MSKWKDDENRILSSQAHPGANHPRPGARIADSEPTIRDPRLGILLHVELSNQPTPRRQQHTPRRRFRSLMKSSSFQTPKCPTINAQHLMFSPTRQQAMPRRLAVICSDLGKCIESYK
ncbi:hypothetical protein PIB30_061312 [Stylosanthes scabra]|uniref:Uncharacterized protein n=1 Tax=Stylosanthes scabra TaxID=79078 RepID=A0ABU6RL55_9FABA|nr:hypothetical protein [Stylosanthes scabra]